MLRKVIGYGMIILGGISIARGIKWYSDSMKAIRNLEANINNDLENALKQVVGKELKGKTPISVDSLCDDEGLENMIGNCNNQVSIDGMDDFDFEAHSTPWTEPLV
ncbi:hypothetical protein [Bacteroides acidifaciens]|uniref:hypothetical protein n=1 Tax=Bacteroides acidifaciens TaxID=85831 RepID=UPI0026F32BA2|nr:hypothetical protein [Bacteroides acidifaciens]